MYDLHTHSCFSDGALPPEKLIKEATNAGLTLMALTDHDTAAGVSFAAAEAERVGMPFLPGIEIEADYPEELHILGLGIDPEAAELKDLVIRQEDRRRIRNEALLCRLADAGMDVRDRIFKTGGALTKGDVAAALVEAGYCQSVGEAFRSCLIKGAPFWEPMEHPSVEETMEAIINAGGVAVIAHPMNIKSGRREIIARLKSLGLWGVEAFYSTASDEETRYFLELAKEFGLRPTCGSDFHGQGRRKAELGSAWERTFEVAETELMLKRRFSITAESPVGRPKLSPRRRGFTPDEFERIADSVLQELPEEFFVGLNGGVVIADREKLHSRSVPSRPLYVLGEYHYGGSEGRYVVIYYGSFLRAHGRKRGDALKEEVRKVILHEFRHHLETRAGEHGLEYEDDAFLTAYEEGNTQSRRADIAPEEEMR